MPVKRPEFFAIVLVTACGGPASSTDAGSPDGGGNDAQSSADASFDSPASDAGGGSGTVMGSADGTPFDTVASSLWLGAPDNPQTTVVYVFSKPVQCSDLAMMVSPSERV